MQTVQKFSDIRKKLQVMDDEGKQSLVVEFIDHLLPKLITENDFNENDTLV